MVRISQTSRGFTLIEIVVAVGIFGVLASIIFPALIQFLEIRERVDAKHDQIVGLQKTFMFLTNDLRFAANRLPKDEFGELAKTTLKLNDDGLLDFTAMYPDLKITGLSVPRRVTWRLEEGELQRVQYPVMDPDGDTRTIVQTLLKNVDEVEIEISYIEDGRVVKEDKWEEQSRLPDLIEVTVELEDKLIFNRVLTMQGGDSAAALLAASVLPPGAAGPGGSNVQSGNDGDNTGPGGSDVDPQQSIPVGIDPDDEDQRR